MGKSEYTSYQKGIIDNYYRNLDTILLTRLQEIVTELYLAETDKQKDKLWKRAEKAIVQLKIPDSIKTHILGQKSTEILAQNLQEWLRGVS